MTDSTAAAREQVLDIVAQWDLHRPADMKELLLSALMAAEQRGRDAAVPAGWKPIETAPDGPAIYGYWTQFDTWYFARFERPDEPRKIGYTHWMIPAAPAQH